MISAPATDGRLVASGCSGGTVKLWEADSGRSLWAMQRHTGGVGGVVLSADSRLVASGSFDGTVTLWEAKRGTSLHTLRPKRRYERMDIND